MSLMRAGVLAWRISDSPVALSFFTGASQFEVLAELIRARRLLAHAHR